MAQSIEIGLVLWGEDAEKFLEDLRNPKKPTKERRCFSGGYPNLQRRPRIMKMLLQLADACEIDYMIRVNRDVAGLGHGGCSACGGRSCAR